MGSAHDLESRCARLLWTLRDTGLRERPAGRCSANFPTLAEVQPSVRPSLDRLLEGQVIDEANPLLREAARVGGLLQLPPPSRRSWRPNTLRAPSSESPRPVVIGLRQLHSRMSERIAPSNDGLTSTTSPSGTSRRWPVRRARPTVGPADHRGRPGREGGGDRVPRRDQVRHRGRRYARLWRPAVSSSVPARSSRRTTPSATSGVPLPAQRQYSPHSTPDRDWRPKIR